MVPAFLFRREGLFLVGALGLALVSAGIFWFTRPTTLTVAVGPRHGVEARLMEAYAAVLERTHANIRLTVLSFDDVRDSAAALQADRADLAVVRPDAALPDNGLTVAVLREAAVIVAAPAGFGMTGVPDLSGKRLGLIVQHDADPPLLRRLLEFYGLQPTEPGATGAPTPPAVSVVPLDDSGVADAFAAGRIDAVAVVATPASALAAAMVHAVASADKDGKVAFLPVPDGDALTQRLPELQTVEIAPGTFGGSPKRPEEEVATVGTSYRLMAQEGLSRDVASSVAQHLFELRSRIARSARSANLIKAPGFDDAVGATSARLPNHPGAVDYFQREQQTFFQRYEDMIYLVAFCGGGLGSVVAWLGQNLARKRREAVHLALDRLVDVLGEVRAAGAPELEALAAEIDQQVVAVVNQARHFTIDTRTMGALVLAIDAARAAVTDRRCALGLADPANAVVGRGGRHLPLRAAE